MPMENENLNKFILAINKDAEERRNEIIKEAEEYKKREMEKAEQEVLEDVYRLIQKETQDMRHSISRDIAGKELAGKRALLKQREDITEKVFSDAAAKLREFAQSEEYRGFIKNTVTESLAVLSGTQITVALRPDDMKYAGDIKKLLPGCELAGDESIEIGGIRITDIQSGIIVDQTLDARLASQRGWFIEQAKLSIL